MRSVVLISLLKLMSKPFVQAMATATGHSNDYVTFGEMRLDGTLEVLVHIGWHGYTGVTQTGDKLFGWDYPLLGVFARQVARNPVDLFGPGKDVFVVVEHKVLPPVR